MADEARKRTIKTAHKASICPLCSETVAVGAQIWPIAEIETVDDVVEARRQTRGIGTKFWWPHLECVLRKEGVQDVENLKR